MQRDTKWAYICAGSGRMNRLEGANGKLLLDQGPRGT